MIRASAALWQSVWRRCPPATRSFFGGQTLTVHKDVWTTVIGQLSAKDKQLSAKDEQLSSKDEQISAKEKANQQLLDQLQRLHVTVLDQAQLLSDRRQLLNACLEAEGVKDLRGALEVMAAQSIVKGGTAAFFDALAKNVDFKLFVKRASNELSQANRFAFRDGDVLLCVGSLYHTLSCGQHGTPPGTMTVAMGPKLESNQVAAICLVAEFFNFPYTLVDKNGNVVDEGFRIPNWTASSLSAFKS